MLFRGWATVPRHYKREALGGEAFVGSLSEPQGRNAGQLQSGTSSSRGRRGRLLAKLQASTASCGHLGSECTAQLSLSGSSLPRQEGNWALM